MNDNARRWVEALRSGHFKQGRYALTNFDEGDNRSHCCLGVACVLAARDGIVESDPVPLEMFVAYNGETSLLPYEVQQWLGMDSPSGRFHYTEALGGASLAELNDVGHTFEEIADIIESEPRGLFV